MTGKHDTAERLPLAQRLSGLFPRRSSDKSSRKPPGTSHEHSEKASVFRMKRQRGQAPPPRTAQEFKPLEVDVAMLEAFRLADGWLDRNTDGDRKQQQQPPQKQKQPAPATDSSATPIADLFANRSILDFPISEQPSRSVSPRRSGSIRRPYSMIEAPSPAFIGASADPAPIPEEAGSILDRGRPVEPKDLLRKSQEAASAAEKAAAAAKEAQKSSRFGGAGSGSRLDVSSRVSQAENFKSSSRHSMYAGVPPPNPLATSKTWNSQSSLQSSRSVSATPLDRIQSWQRSVTSNSSSSSAAAPPAAGLSRRMSTRGSVTGNRLAWIKELEEKKSSSVGRDIGVLKKQAGSVSDKLAMFESKQEAPIPRMPPTRSNSTSTTSRLSSGNVESITSAYGNTTTATPRTSIDTVRSSHRASSVMNYYDDTFREKMESIVSGFEAEKEKPPTQKLQRVTTQFVSIKPKTGAEEPQSPKPEAGPSNQESEKAEETQPEAAPSATEPEMPEEPQPSQPAEGPSTEEKPEEKTEEKTEEKAEEEVQESQPEEVVAAVESAEKVEEDVPSNPQPEAGSSIDESATKGEDQPQEGPANVESEKGDEVQSFQPDASPSDTKEEKGEENLSSQPEAGSSSLEAEKGEEEL